MTKRLLVGGMLCGLLLQGAGQTADKPARKAGAKPPVPKSAAPKNPRLTNAPQTLDKLSRLSPEERQRALAKLPAQRRDNIEKRLQEFDKMPAGQQERVRERLEKLNALPQERRVEVRRSIQEFSTFPQERKAGLNREVRKLAAMDPAVREQYLASPGFRDKYSEGDRRLIADLVEVAPSVVRQ